MKFTVTLLRNGIHFYLDPVSFTVEETPGKSTLNSSRVRSIVDIQNQAEFKGFAH